MGLFVDILRLPLPFPEIAWLFMAFNLAGCLKLDLFDFWVMTNRDSL